MTTQQSTVSRERTDLEYWAREAYQNRKEWWKRSGSAILEPAFKAMLTKIENEFYNYYSAYEYGVALDPSEYKPFLEKLKATEDMGDGGKKFVVYPQSDVEGVKKKSKGNVGVMAELMKLYDSDRKVKRRMDNNFAYRVMVGSDAKPSKSSRSTRARITLRLNPKTATDVLQCVATDIVGSDSSKFRYVSQAKVMGPVKIGTSSDSLIIYLMTTNSQRRAEIIEHLKSKFEEDAFITGGPPTMLELGQTGFSYAERANKPQSGSHGKSRSSPMSKAFAEAMLFDPNLSFAEFLEQVDKRLTIAGIDPQNPWKNL